MSDVVDPQTRSRMMSGIRGTNTQPERLVRSYLHRCGLRFILGGAGLPGRPDLVLPRYKAAVFVHGCFWHRHPGCNLATIPATRTAFWLSKFEKNVARDALVTEALRTMGWRPHVIWACELNSIEALENLFWSIVSMDS